MDKLIIGFVQADLAWEDTTANLSHFEEQIARFENSPNVIVLPEMFSTGFSMEPVRIAEPANFTTTRWMLQIAAQYNALVVGSIAVREEQNYYNRLLAVKPDGTYQVYNKRHLFRMGNEHEVYSQGLERITVEWQGWKICPLICYDLRFPVWSRQDNDNMYDVLLYVANWPTARQGVWDTLLRARALENQSFVIGVNRLGEDGKGVPHSGNSTIVDFKGSVLIDAKDQADVFTTTISKSELEKFREKFPAYLDADSFEIKKGEN